MCLCHKHLSKIVKNYFLLIIITISVRTVNKIWKINLETSIKNLMMLFLLENFQRFKNFLFFYLVLCIIVIQLLILNRQKLAWQAWRYKLIIVFQINKRDFHFSLWLSFFISFVIDCFFFWFSSKICVFSFKSSKLNFLIYFPCFHRSTWIDYVDRID